MTSKVSDWAFVIKTRLFQDPKEMKSACSFMRYCINVCLPVHVMQNVNTKQFKVINAFYKDLLTTSTIQKRLRWLPCKRTQDRFLGLCIIYLHFVIGGLGQTGVTLDKKVVVGLKNALSTKKKIRKAVIAVVAVVTEPWYNKQAEIKLTSSNQCPCRMYTKYTIYILK